jgi:biopolymer transport protein ExbD
MAQIRKNIARQTPKLATASLPDIIFMLLFFFMAVTTGKDAEFKVRVTPPVASEATRLINKSLTRYIYAGKPLASYAATFGSETRIQLGDAFVDINDLETWVINERSKLSELEQGNMIVAIKADKDTKMGLISDIKQHLRNANALKIVYIAEND